MGGRLDFGPRDGEQPPFVGQVKNPRVFSLNALTKITMEMDEIAESPYGRAAKGEGVVLMPREHYGVVVIKVSNGRPSPHLIVFTEDTWLKLRKLLPFDWESALRKGEGDGQETRREDEQQVG